jgi:hypothetical protein
MAGLKEHTDVLFKPIANRYRFSIPFRHVKRSENG